MEKYLRRCLDSLIIDEEGMKQLEVLVINDGSKDSSSQIAHEYQDKYPDTYRVIDKENGNYGSCINRGLKEATGKYVKVLDADDWFDNDSFNHYVNDLKSEDVDLVFSDFNLITEDGIVVNESPYSALFEHRFNNINISEFFRSYPNFYGRMHGFTYKLCVIKDMKYVQTEGISYTDTEWVNIPITRAKTCSFLPYVLYQYLIGREDQTMAVIHSKAMFQFMEVILNISKFINNGDFERNIYLNYLLREMKSKLEYVYMHGLYYNDFDINMLKRFDQSLKEFPQIYKIGEEIKIKPFQYVKIWRNQKYSIPLYLFLFVKLRKILKHE